MYLPIIIHYHNFCKQEILGTERLKKKIYRSIDICVIFVITVDTYFSLKSENLEKSLEEFNIYRPIFIWKHVPFSAFHINI